MSKSKNAMIPGNSIVDEKSIEARRSEYFETLGRFVDAFTHAEKIVHLSFEPHSGFTHEVARTIKGGMKLSDLIALIKRLLVANNAPKETLNEFSTIFDQLSIISQFRDSIIHRGIYMNDDGALSVNNFATAKSIDQFEIANFSLDDIRCATRDLQKITDRIIRVTWGMHHDLQISWDLDGPWLYKQVQLRNPRQQPRSKTPGRKRQQKPSQE